MTTFVYCVQDKTPHCMETDRKRLPDGRNGRERAPEQDTPAGTGEKGGRKRPPGQSTAFVGPSALCRLEHRISGGVRHGVRAVRRCLKQIRRPEQGGEQPPCTVTELPDVQILCYKVSAEEKKLREQVRSIPGERVWYEKSIADQLGLRQPELRPEEIQCLIRAALRPDRGGRTESILVIEPPALPEREHRMDWDWTEKEPEGNGTTAESEPDRLKEDDYQELLRVCLADRNHYTILAADEARYEALAAEALEQDGLLVRCIRTVTREYPLGERLLILNFRPDYRPRPWMLERDARCLTVSAEGIVKFLDTIVKNRYNI